MKKKYIIFVSCFFVLVTCIYIGLNPGIPAVAADSILRPLIGEKNTLTLESLYFNTGDTLKELQSKLKKPNSNIFTPALTQTKTATTSAALNLTPLAPIFSMSPLPNEGVWTPIPQQFFPTQTVIAKTFIRPDSTRNYAIVSLVKMDMTKLALGVEAGTYYPGGTHRMYGPGTVPKKIQESNMLLAVFNGGFMERDGHYGMMVGNRTYVPLRTGLATLIMNTDGSMEIVDYEGQSLGSNVAAVRQNGPFLIRDGAITPYVESGADTWGRTTTNSMYTWRSGIGITAQGNLIYAVGNSLVPNTLAVALKSAGAINAMQLDINQYWVRFILYSPLGNGTYSYYPLLKEMQNGGYAYLHGYNKDFFYIYRKNS